jgi:GMP synthase (glutamine-hydrolysing)
MSKRIDVIRHVAFEDLGLWQAPLANVGAAHYLQAGVDDLSQLDHHKSDLLVVLGGPIGVYEDDQYPFIKTELEIIRTRLKLGLPILGICLGAQLIAAAAGARVYPSGLKEIGWGAISLTDAGAKSCLNQLSVCDHTVLHWHGDTFDLPSNATLLASSPLVKHQAYSIGPNVLALQFHAEMNPAMMDTWLIGHTCELGHAGIKPNDIRLATQQLPNNYAACSERVIRSWLKQIGFS